MRLSMVKDRLGLMGSLVGWMLVVMVGMVGVVLVMGGRLRGGVVGEGSACGDREMWWPTWWPTWWPSCRRGWCAHGSRGDITCNKERGFVSH